MEYNRLIDRKAETDRITEAPERENLKVWFSSLRFFTTIDAWLCAQSPVTTLWTCQWDYQIEEPQRLLRDDMRDTVQASTLFTIIGNGANKLSEIASRAGKEANSLSEPLGKLRDLGYISREVPFGDNPKKSKKGLYHINDSLLRFHYQFRKDSRYILSCLWKKPLLIWTKKLRYFYLKTSCNRKKGLYATVNGWRIAPFCCIRDVYSFICLISSAVPEGGECE